MGGFTDIRMWPALVVVEDPLRREELDLIDMLLPLERTACICAVARPTLADRDPVVIRLDRVGDHDGLRRLAVLNGAPAPTGDHVVAEVRGTIVAALPLDGRGALCDWIAAAHLVPLLELRAAQIAGESLPRARRLSRHRLRFRRGWNRLVR